MIARQKRDGHARTGGPGRGGCNFLHFAALGPIVIQYALAPLLARGVALALVSQALARQRAPDGGDERRVLEIRDGKLRAHVAEAVHRAVRH